MYTACMYIVTVTFNVEVSINPFAILKLLRTQSIKSDQQMTPTYFRLTKLITK